MSFVNAVNVAGFCMGGPEYISSRYIAYVYGVCIDLFIVIAGESREPRRTVPRAFSTIMTRLIVFFIGGCLCVGVSVMPIVTQMDTDILRL
jgi:amino acid transporter